MQHRYSRYFWLIFILIDLFCLNILYLLSLINYGRTPSNRSLILLTCLSIVWIFIFYFSRLHAIERDLPLKKQLRRVFQCGTYFGLLIFIFQFFSGQGILPPHSLFYFLVSYLAAILTWRVLLELSLGYYRSKGYNQRNMAVIGYTPEARYVTSSILRKPRMGYHFKGFFGPTLHPSMQGNTQDIQNLIEKGEIHVLYFCLQHYNDPKLNKLLQIATQFGVRIKLLPEGNLFRKKRMFARQHGSLSVWDLSYSPLDNMMNRFLKRSFDIAFSSLVLITLLSWLTPFLGLLIKSSKGPIFFLQPRQGLNNKVFLCYKFRSMYLNKDPNRQQTIPDDPRITPIGKILRKLSLDEIPQFINVFLGNMSVVGPRPHTPNLNLSYEKEVEGFWERHSIKPGITGLAQIRGLRGEIKNRTDMRRRVRMDRFYIQNWSLFLDLNIIIRTLTAIMKHPRAY
ncbi:MAG: exopolysaccharide biosynthesis polyprenyl glycosylphosphotransferase [Cytophagales bacterium]|nr:exopolysaccharide biosynthesis polyprenyl glycosylphosphotransferase [Cytophagales bacterium]